MSNNSSNAVNKAESKIDDKRDTCILLKNIAVDFEEQLYSITMQLKTQNNLLLQKEQELKEIGRTKVHNLNLFSPIHNQTNDTAETNNEINTIKQKINQLENELQVITKKVMGLKAAAQIIEAINDEKDDISLESEIDNSDKGLGILEAQEIERQRIARDLHDTTVQNLTSLVHKSELCVKLIDIDSIRAKLELNTMSNTLKIVINDMRGMIYNLKPMTLDDLGLTITIERFANRIMSQSNIQVRVFSNQEPTEILPVIRLTLFRIIQETCNNVVKHANASLIDIDIKYEEKKIQVTIKDDGSGFDTSKLNRMPSEQPSSFGLSIMKERISLLSGSIDIKSEKGLGTSISISIPLTKYEGDKNEQAD